MTEDTPGQAVPELRFHALLMKLGADLPGAERRATCSQLSYKPTRRSRTMSTVLNVSIRNRLQGQVLNAILHEMEKRSLSARHVNSVLEIEDHLFRLRLHVHPDRVDIEAEPSGASRDGSPAMGGASEMQAAIEANFGPIFSHEYRTYPTKVFGIGFPRTATTSLAAALRSLGICTLHYAPWLAFELRQGRFKNLTTDLFTGLTDSPYPIIYREMDQMYPGSKFILTMRNVKKWIPSIKFLNGDSLPEFRRMYYGIDHYDEQVYVDRYTRHCDEVQTYFRDRPDDLLLLDFSQDVSWAQLCVFLSLPQPSGPFPCLNKRG